MMQNQSCEQCTHFVYDDQWDCYACEMELDMDETEQLLSNSRWNCPYFRFGDEYDLVRKQN